MAAETEPLAAERGEKSEEQPGRVPLWFVVLAVLALGIVVEVIIYGCFCAWEG